MYIRHTAGRREERRCSLPALADAGKWRVWLGFRRREQDGTMGDGDWDDAAGRSDSTTQPEYIVEHRCGVASCLSVFWHVLPQSSMDGSRLQVVWKHSCAARRSQPREVFQVASGCPSSQGVPVVESWIPDSGVHLIQLQGPAPPALIESTPPRPGTACPSHPSPCETLRYSVSLPLSPAPVRGSDLRKHGSPPARVQ